MKLVFNRFNLVKIMLVSTILVGIFLAACSKSSSSPAPTPADKTALKDSVAVAVTLYDGTVEGTKPDQYEVGSKAAFKTVLDAAKAVLADANATQTAVTNAVAQLQAAMTAYKAHRIKEIAAQNLVAYWKMNGNANDSSGNGHNGVLTTGAAYYGAGMPVLTTDRFGRANMAYHFDKGGNIEVPYSSSLNPQQMSISVWVKKVNTGRTVNADTYTIVAMNRWNMYKYQLQSTNKFFFTVKTANGADTAIYDRDDNTAVLDSNVWYHGVVTYKAGQMNFYVNGDLVQSWTDTPKAPITLASPINFVIGQDLPTSKYLTVDGDYQVAWGGFWTGDMDDIMFYNVALDAPQVKSIYNNQKAL